MFRYLTGYFSCLTRMVLLYQHKNRQSAQTACFDMQQCQSADLLKAHLIALLFFAVLPEERAASDAEFCSAVIVDLSACFGAVCRLDDMCQLSAAEAFHIGAVLAVCAAVFPDIVFRCAVCPVNLNKAEIADPVVSEHDMLVQVNEMKTTFLSDASHELKAPLAAMSGYAQDAELDLMNGGEQSTVQSKLRRISSEANRMALMVTQILDATRIEEGRMVLEKAPCDLDALVRKTVETYFAVLNKNNNRLILRIPIDLPQVDADSTRLQIADSGENPIEQILRK